LCYKIKRCGINKILLKCGVKVNVANNKGKTPLHAASTIGNEEEITLLIKHGANRDALDQAGQTPAKIALNTKKKYNIYELIQNFKYTG